MDIGVIDHNTNNLGNMTINYPNQGSNNMLIGNSEGLVIKYIGSSHVTILSQSFILYNIFYYPNALANQLSVQIFVYNNDNSFTFDTNNFVA